MQRRELQLNSEFKCCKFLHHIDINIFCFHSAIIFIVQWMMIVKCPLVIFKLVVLLDFFYNMYYPPQNQKKNNIF